MAKTNEPHAAEKLNRIVSGTNITGEIVSDSNIRIDGNVKGTISVKGRLVVGATGKIEGQIECENAEIEGTVNGTILVNGLLSLKATARLECDITTKKLVIESGAVFNGKTTMGGGVVKEMNKSGDQEQHTSNGDKRANQQ